MNSLKVWPEQLKGLSVVLDGAYDVQHRPFDKPPVVLDVGANIGAFSVWAAKRWPGAELHAYEPHPQHVHWLSQNVEGIDPAVTIHPVAVVGVKYKPREFLFDGKHNTGECSLRIPGEITGRYVDVVAASELPPCDVLKLDTEGAEGEILEHYPHLYRVSLLMLEWHYFEDYHLFTRRLPQLGFTVLRDDAKGASADERNLIFARSSWHLT